MVFESGSSVMNKMLASRHRSGPYDYSDVIMGRMTSQITSLTIVYSTVYSGANQRKHLSSALLAFVRGIHRSPVNLPDKWPATRKMFSIWWRLHILFTNLGLKCPSLIPHNEGLFFIRLISAIGYSIMMKKKQAQWLAAFYLELLESPYMGIYDKWWGTNQAKRKQKYEMLK